MKDIKEIPLNFMYQYTRLFNLGLNRKKFVCVSTNDKLYAMNTSKNTFLALLFTLFSCGLLFSGFIEAFVNKNEITTEFVIVFFVIHIIVGLIGLRQFLWLLRGREEMTIENGYLTLTKKGTFLTSPKIYSLGLITNIRQAINEDNLSLVEKIKVNMSLNMNVLLWQTIGQIAFDYKGKTINVFNDMDNNERIELIAEMTKRK